MDIQVNVKYTIKASVSEVYDAIQDPNKINGFFVSKTTGPIEEGKNITWYWDDVCAELEVTGVEVIANERIHFRWKATGKETDVVIALSKTDAGTVIEINETGWSNDASGIKHAMGQTQGWTDFVCSMKAYLYTGVNIRTGSNA